MAGLVLALEWPVEGGPDGIAIGPDGSVFVNINNNYRVVKYTAEGDELAAWSVDGGMDGVAVGPDHNLYIADKANGCIRVFRLP